MSILNADLIRGKRLMALDYGERRTGVAVCDEMHILVSSRPVLETNESIIQQVLLAVERERIEVLIVGVPMYHDGRVTPIIAAIERFVECLRETSPIPVVTADEAFSTKDARSIMVASGMKKKKRQTKGIKDQVAAAVILQRVLDEHSSRSL